MSCFSNEWLLLIFEGKLDLFSYLSLVFGIFNKVSYPSARKICFTILGKPTPCIAKIPDYFSQPTSPIPVLFSLTGTVSSSFLAWIAHHSMRGVRGMRNLKTNYRNSYPSNKRQSMTACACCCIDVECCSKSNVMQNAEGLMNSSCCCQTCDKRRNWLEQSLYTSKLTGWGQGRKLIEMH